MPQKRIPIPTQDAVNWGIILNDHLAQTKNPINGAFNSFDQFSSRPTNLTADDVGRTYLYTQTGNWHEWSGTEWKVQNKSEINVKDYGAVGDGVTDDTAAVQVLINQCSATNNKPLYFPEGTFLINIVFGYFSCNIVGAGRYSTKLTSYTPTGFAITYKANETWSPTQISNLAIIGNFSRTKNGISFGEPTFVNGDQFAGGLRMTQIYMTDMDICILKKYGCIGNYFESCSFRSSNYHYKVIAYKGGVNPGDHSGCDTFLKCEFGGAIKSSIYIDGNNEGVNGQHIFRDCVFQGNPGFCFYVKRYSAREFTPGLMVVDTWFEFNSVKESSAGVFTTNDPVDIDGVMLSPRQFYFSDVNARIENCYVYEIELIRSNVITKGTASDLIGLLPATNVIKDQFSSITFDEVSSYVDFMHYNRRPIYLNAGQGSRTTITAPRQVISKSSDNLIYSDSFAERENLFFNGLTGGNYGKLVKDGRLFDRCLEVTFDASNNNQDYIMDPANSFEIPKEKFYFWSIDIKKVSGDDLEIVYSKDFRLGSYIKIQNSQWTTLVGLGDTFGYDANYTTPLTVWPAVFSKNKNVIFRISCFQVLAFDSQQELIEYSDSLQFRTKTDKLISSSSSLPITGDYNKGDIVYNTNPTPGGYVGWICTTSGTPGTWNTFGAIN